eukprot:GFYU01001015.1.p1 GENE.GFYU01001015.1~~GFYU01001015.1.p1  ORF type:complete len:339 (+),score=129.79 GFYU01001015.1:74-1018(+)
MKMLRKMPDSERPGNILMVDSDTQVLEMGILLFINRLQTDAVVGVCGETLVANGLMNKWTKMQVWEYLVSHIIGKAFESYYGFVSCLPGCFCMYRTDVLLTEAVLDRFDVDAAPDSIRENNLLKLGEDRYLTFLVLMQCLDDEPRKRMVFVKEAQCTTIVPEGFGIFVRQRKRWNNSTYVCILECIYHINFKVPLLLYSNILELFGAFVVPIITIHLVLVIISLSGPVNYFELVVGTLELMLLASWVGAMVLVAQKHNKEDCIFFVLYYLAFFMPTGAGLPFYSLTVLDDFKWGGPRSDPVPAAGGEEGEEDGH